MSDTQPTATQPTTEAEKDEEDEHKEEHSDVPDVVINSDLYKTLEELEEPLFKTRAKLYRFDKSNNEWKERGTGEAKILKHKETGKVRILMRRDKTYKICANHFLSTLLTLQPNKSNDKSWIWNCPADFADGTPTEEIFAIRFVSVNDAKDFKKAWEDGAAMMAKLGSANEKPAENKAEEKAASDAAAAATEETKAT